MPPSLMVRQRQAPVRSPADGAWLAGLSTERIAEASPEPVPAWASASAFCLASPRRARRCWSNCVATSCQPAAAALADSARTKRPSRAARLPPPALRATSPVNGGGNLLDAFANIRLGPFRRVGAVVRRSPAIERRRGRYADDVVAGVDEVHLAGDAARQVAEQIGGGAADLVERDVELERRLRLVPLEHGPGVADGRAGQRAHRAGGNRVHADAVAAEIGSQIAHARFERGLGDAHDVVVRRDAAGAEIRYRDQRATPRHQPRGALRHGGEGVAGDVERAAEIGPRRIYVAALELILVGERDGMDEEIETAPRAVEPVEHRIELLVVLDVGGQHDLRADRLRQRLEPL